MWRGNRRSASAPLLVSSFPRKRESRLETRCIYGPPLLSLSKGAGGTIKINHGTPGLGVLAVQKVPSPRHNLVGIELPIALGRCGDRGAREPGAGRLALAFGRQD